MDSAEIEKFLAKHGDTEISNPMNPDEIAPLTDAVGRCVDPKTGANHLLKIFAELSVDDAEKVIADLTPQQAEQS